MMIRLPIAKISKIELDCRILVFFAVFNRSNQGDSFYSAVGDIELKRGLSRFRVRLAVIFLAIALSKLAFQYQPGLIERSNDDYTEQSQA